MHTGVVPTARSNVVDTSDPGSFFDLMRSFRPGLAGFAAESSGTAWHARVDVLTLPGIRVAAQRTAGYRFSGTADSLYFSTMLRGSVELTRRNQTQAPGAGMVIPHVNDDVSLRIGAGYQGVAISCRREAFADACADFCTEDPGLLLRAAEAAPERLDFSRYVQNVRWLNGLIGCGDSSLLADARFLGEAGEVLLASLAGAATSRLPLGSTPRARRHLARAIAYIDAHFAEDLRIGAIALAAGCSIRLLQDQFRAVEGRSILQYITARRLAHARRLLLHGQGGHSVTSAALESGFSHFGLFAQHYRAAYREVPSATRANARARATTAPRPATGNGRRRQ